MKPLNELKKDILKYQRSRDRELFADIIFNVDFLIRYFIKRIKSQYNYLWKIDSEDLYNDSIIALSNSMISFTANIKSEYIPCRLKAYMVEEFRKSYSYKMIEISSADRLSDDIPAKEYPSTSNEINLKKIDYKIMMDNLDKEEKEFLKNFLTQTRDNGKMAKKHGIEGKYPGDNFRITATRLIQKRFKK